MMKYFVEILDETYVPSEAGVKRPEFSKLSLTDAILLEALKFSTENTPFQLLTVDLDLAIAAEIAGYKVQNFNHLRDF